VAYILEIESGEGPHLDAALLLHRNQIGLQRCALLVNIPRTKEYLPL